VTGNPLERLRVEIGGKESEGREPWTKDELGLIFSDPLCAYSTRWRTRFQADGGQCSTAMADTVPR
jgi:hypothetical protein